MRFSGVPLLLAVALLVGACDFWPKDLKRLAESVSERVSGETTAWQVGGDVVIIDITGSPLYGESEGGLEAAATDIAKEALAFSETPLESVVITFHEGAATEDSEKSREFIFLVGENGAVLQPPMDFDARGPLSPEEVQAAVDRLGEGLPEEQKACVLLEVQELAAAAGDPDTLDPAKVDYLPETSWNLLDPFGKRLILMQAITTEAVFDCAQRKS